MRKKDKDPCECGHPRAMHTEDFRWSSGQTRWSCVAYYIAPSSTSCRCLNFKLDNLKYVANHAK